jgi:hypothetical protein
MAAHQEMTESSSQFWERQTGPGIWMKQSEEGYKKEFTFLYRHKLVEHNF